MFVSSLLIDVSFMVVVNVFGVDVLVIVFVG